MEKLTDGQLKISVRNLVEFICRYGDIDNRRTTGGSVELMSAGSRIHRKIQGKMGKDYRSEVPLKKVCPFDRFTITVEGRADGVITEDESVTIDEIKSVKKSITMIKEADRVHLAQAMVYAYIYSEQNELDRINIRMTYCSMETEEIKQFVSEYSFSCLRKWFNEIMAEYSKWIEYLYDEKIKSVYSIRPLQFPFEYRKGQRELVVSAYKTISEGKNLFIQAPTGVGKTMSVVSPAVKAVGEGFGDKVFYLTAKTVTAKVAEDAFDTLKSHGLHFKTITITAKEKICVMDETECNPEYCPRAKGHFDRINDAVYDMITNEINITREIILKYAEKHNVCPFEMTLDASNWVDGIICDYNYVFDPNVNLKRYFAEGEKGEYIFLVDEAHNLVERAREMYSAKLVKEQFLLAKRKMKNYSSRIEKLIGKCNSDMLSYKRECKGYSVRSEADSLLKHLQQLKTAFDKFLDEHREFDGRKEILEFYFDITNFLNISDRVDESYEIYTELGSSDEFTIKLFCVDPANNLKECLKKGNSTIFFSATMLPINYYKELLSGNTHDYAVYINSPFERDNRIILNGTDVSSKYTRRTKEEYIKIGRYIIEIISGRKGNYMVFFPSYKMMEAVYDAMEEMFGENENAENAETAVPGGLYGFSSINDLNILLQKRSMSEAERNEFIDRFGKEDESNITAFCVLGGIFSEGIDLKNESLIGSIIVGTGLPMVCTEKEILKAHYDREGKSGFDYAYRFPGMNKVQQAAGRVIRTDSERGVIVLLDERFGN